MQRPSPQLGMSVQRTDPRERARRSNMVDGMETPLGFGTTVALAGIVIAAALVMNAVID